MTTLEKLPSEIPTWATDGGTTLEPDAGEKAAGWDTNIRPPARWMNWWMNNVGAHASQLHAVLTRDWTVRPYPNDPGFLEFCWHKGAFYGLGSDDTLWRSEDGKAWRRVNAGPINNSPEGFLFSDDTTLLSTSDPANFAHWSIDDGQTWTQAAGLVASGGNMLPYFPNAGIWAGTNGIGVGVQSALGQTWVGNTIAGGAGTHEYAENADGSDLRVANSFSTDQGASWAPQTNIPLGVFQDYYFFSQIRGTFFDAMLVGVDIDLYESSGTPGDWDLVPFATIVAPAGFTYARRDRMWESRGVMYMAVGLDYIGGAPEQDRYGFVFSTDAGLTWTFQEVGSIVLATQTGDLDMSRDTGLMLIQSVSVFGGPGGLATLPFTGIQP